MDKQYLILPACFSIFLNVVVLGIVTVNLCDYSDTWSIIGCWGLVIILACLFKVYVVIPYALLWWGAIFCQYDGYGVGAVLFLTMMVAAATFIATIVHQIRNHSGKPDKKSQVAGKNNLDAWFIGKCLLFSVFCPPAAAILGIITTLGTCRELTSKK